MPVRDDHDSYDREILDIIPERFDADPDSHYARKGAHTRLILTAALGLLALAALGVAARHLFFDDTPKQQAAGVPVIKPDDRPIKTKPDDRGGMDVPNQDKLVYERMGANADAGQQSERLLPPPEQPQEPPAQLRTPTIKPAFPPPQGGSPAEAAAAGRPAAPAEPAPAQTAPTPAAPAQTAQPGHAAGQQTAANNTFALSPAKPTTPGAKPAPHAAAGKQTAAAAPAATAPAAPAQATPAAVSSAPKAAAGGSWVVQLGALKTEAEAHTEWGRVKGANKDLLGEYGPDIVRVELPGKGTFWRLRAGPMDEGQARSICAQIAKRNQGCIIAKK